MTKKKPKHHKNIYTNYQNYNKNNETNKIIKKKIKSIIKKKSLHSFDVLHDEGYPFLADNHYILHGYRLNYSIRECFISIFEFHNETLNVWTHLIGSIIFIICFFNIFQENYTNEEMMELNSFHLFHFIQITKKKLKLNLNSETVLSIWPISVFIISTIICLTCSALFHLMYCHSSKVYFFLSRLDYAGIALMIAGSNFPIIYYSFYCFPIIRNFYLLFITIIAIITFSFSLFPFFGTVEYLYIRTSIFLLLGMYIIIPIIHLIIKFGIYDRHITELFIPLVIMGFFYLMGAIIYATRFPERFYPGKFDVWFSSHQLWHICVLAGALIHLNNATKYYQWREDTKCL